MKKILRFLIITLIVTIIVPFVSAENLWKINNFETNNTEFICEISDNIDIQNLEYGYIDRDKIIDIAKAYADYHWYPTVDNIFHGICPICGEKVDTSDRDYFTNWYDFWGWKSGELNIGIPYKAGGFSSVSGFNLTNPEDFYEQYTGTGSYQDNIHYGGDVYLNKLYPCSYACGVDCSGFVSRCWNLPQKHCTFPYPEYPFGLQNVSSPIRFNDLKPGDLLNSPKYHSILFKGFVDDDTITIIDTGGCAWQVAEYNCDVTFISRDGFNIRLKGTFYNLTYDFSNQLFRPRQYNYISNTPMPPIIQGPTNCKRGKEYNYTLNATDPNGDDLYYIIEWGDILEEIGPYPSGELIIVNHTWLKSKECVLRIKVRDSTGLESGYEEMKILISRVNVKNNHFQNLYRFFDNISKILRLFLFTYL
jgi:hypothetical protein